MIIEIYIDIILDVALTSSTDRLETSGPLFYYSLRLGTVILHFRSAHDWQFRTKAGVWPLDNVVNSVCVQRLFYNCGSRFWLNYLTQLDVIGEPRIWQCEQVTIFHR